MANCKGQEQEDTSGLKDSANSQKNIPIIPVEQQITYAIHINAKTPYEIYLDDIPLPGFGRVYESGMNATLELNPYLLSNGKHILKVIYLPRPDAENNLIQPSHIISSKDSKWNIYFVRYIKNAEDPLGYEGEIDYGNSELEVIAPPEPVAVWEQEFELEIKDLPYDLLGWSESQDLSKMDDQQLKNDVFEYFESLRTILNSGDVETLLNITEKREKEISISTYDYDTSCFYSEENKNDIIHKCKGNMWPILKEDFNVKIYANGRLATIERIEKFKNAGLVAETETNYYKYDFKIHKPKGSGTFEIIRK